MKRRSLKIAPLVSSVAVWIVMVTYLSVLGVRLRQLPSGAVGTSIGLDVIICFHALGITAGLLFIAWARVSQVSTARTIVGTLVFALPVLVMLYLNVEGLVWHIESKGPGNLIDWIQSIR
jgi:hypothetical protein